MLKVNDRVKREIDVFRAGSDYKYGIIIRHYSKPAKRYSSGSVLGPYPDLFDVRWDNGTVSKGHLPHGLTLVRSFALGS